MHTNNRNDDEIHCNAEGCEWVCSPNNTWLPRYAQTNNLPYPSWRSNFSPVPPHAQLNMSTRLPPLSSMGMLPPPSQFNFVEIQLYQSKGKAKATPDIDDNDTTSRKCKRGSQKGRISGSLNYTDKDLAWSRCADEFNEQAEQQGQPTHLEKSLQIKYKQLVKTTKPTGDAELPRNVEEALKIEELMNDKAGMRDLDDLDIDSELDKENATTRKKSKATVKKQSSATG
ncbi:hypothetical protein EV368DRAFT_63132 [Lentinula lateritia]|nr:hypothetical protein EV368DRAFT_63132 [Lentinula lateritia]